LFSGNNINIQTISTFRKYSEDLEKYNFDAYNLIMQRKDKLMTFLESADDYSLYRFKMKYHNQAIEDMVRKNNTTIRAEVYNNKLIQYIDPIYNDNFSSNGYLNYTTQFYAPVKPFLTKEFDTFWFNLTIIWLMTIGLYMTLYFDWLAKLLSLFTKVKINKNMFNRTKS